MWLLVATYKWETAGHPIFNFSMLWKAFKLAAAEAESAHLVVSVPGTIRSIKTTSILPETLQGVRICEFEIRSWLFTNSNDDRLSNNWSRCKYFGLSLGQVPMSLAQGGSL